MDCTYGSYDTFPWYCLSNFYKFHLNFFIMRNKKVATHGDLFTISLLPYNSLFPRHTDTHVNNIFLDTCSNFLLTYFLLAGHT